MRCRKRSVFIMSRRIFKVTLDVISLACCLLLGLKWSLFFAHIRAIVAILDFYHVLVLPSRAKCKLATSCDFGKERDYSKPQYKQKAREMIMKTIK